MSDLAKDLLGTLHSTDNGEYTNYNCTDLNIHGLQQQSYDSK